ncbi:MAG: FtsX-like permease family protein [Terriglobia bacterium]
MAIINETMAQRFWPAADPLGQRVKLGSRPDDGAWLSIVGVVGDVSRGWLRYQVSPTVYLPYRQAPRLSMSLALRTRAPPEAMVAALRTRILSVDSNQPIYEVRSMNRILTEFTSGVRAAAGIMGVFAGLAFLLSAAGIYAVASYAVSQRTHEIGVRMALGARQADILKLFVAQGMRLALFGVGLGLAAAWTLTRLASGFLLGVIDVDAGTFLAFGVGLLGVAILASYLPARRAARVDPMTALRYE